MDQFYHYRICFRHFFSSNRSHRPKWSRVWGLHCPIEDRFRGQLTLIVDRFATAAISGRFPGCIFFEVLMRAPVLWILRIMNLQQHVFLKTSWCLQWEITSSLMTFMQRIVTKHFFTLDLSVELHWARSSWPWRTSRLIRSLRHCRRSGGGQLRGRICCCLVFLFYFFFRSFLSCCSSSSSACCCCCCCCCCWWWWWWWWLWLWLWLQWSHFFEVDNPYFLHFIFLDGPMWHPTINGTSSNHQELQTKEELAQELREASES